MGARNWGSKGSTGGREEVGGSGSGKTVFSDPSSRFNQELKDENDKAISFYENGEVADSRKELVAANKDIALDKSPNSITIQYESKTRKDVAHAHRVIYDFLAQKWGYKSADHMIAIAHTEIVAKAIADPVKFAPSALKAIAQIQEKIHPQEKLTAKETIPGGNKSDIIERLTGHFQKPQKAGSGS